MVKTKRDVVLSHGAVSGRDEAVELERHLVARTGSTPLGINTNYLNSS